MSIVYKSLYFMLDGGASAPGAARVHRVLWVCFVGRDGVCHRLKLGLTDGGGFPERTGVLDDDAGGHSRFLLEHSKHRLPGKAGAALTCATWLDPGCCAVGATTGALYVVRLVPPGAPSSHMELVEGSTWSRLLSFGAAPVGDAVVGVACVTLPGGGPTCSVAVAAHGSGRVRLWSLADHSCAATVELAGTPGTAGNLGPLFAAATVVVLGEGPVWDALWVLVHLGSDPGRSTLTAVLAVSASGPGGGPGPALTPAKTVHRGGAGLTAPHVPPPALVQELDELVGACVVPSGALVTAWRSRGGGPAGPGLGVVLAHGLRAPPPAASASVDALWSPQAGLQVVVPVWAPRAAAAAADAVGPSASNPAATSDDAATHYLSRVFDSGRFPVGVVHAAAAGQFAGGGDGGGDAWEDGVSALSSLRGLVQDVVLGADGRHAHGSAAAGAVEARWQAFLLACEDQWRRSNVLLGVAAGVGTERAPGSVLVLRASGVSVVAHVDAVQVCVCLPVCRWSGCEWDG